MHCVGRAYADLAEIAALFAKSVERQDRASGLTPSIAASDGA